MDRVPFYLRMIRDYDYETFLHCNRVAVFAFNIGEKITLNSQEMNLLVSSAQLHDLGKVKISKSILHKPGKLNKVEWEEICKHSKYGVDILKNDQHSIPPSIIDSIFSHHEYYDGTGYPRGIIGESISIFARIISIADAYDAMTTNRPYRTNCLTPDQAIQEIMKCSGTQFDSNLTRVLKNIDTRLLLPR